MNHVCKPPKKAKAGLSWICPSCGDILVVVERYFKGELFTRWELYHSPRQYKKYKESIGNLDD